MIPKHSLIAGVVVALVCVSVAAHAVTIHGQLVNGTTGEPIDGTVRVVNPAGGMAQEQEVQAVGGNFTIENLDPAQLYLLRSEYAGVMYTETIQPQGQQTVHATLTVYDVTSSWDGVNVIVPHLAAAADAGHLQIEILYEIHNHIEPAATVAGENGRFEFYLPEDRIEIIRTFVSHHDIPLDRVPQPTGKPGIYTVDYPIQPGDTQVNVAYTVPYDDNAYTMSYAVPREIQNMTIYAINANMDVSSDNVTLGAGKPVHGMTAHSVPVLAAGQTLDLTFKGGDPISASPAGGDPHAGGRQPTILMVPNRMENPSILLMVGTMLALLALTGVAMRGAENPLDRREHLQSHYDLLLKRLARLDDLHGTGVVAPDVYRAKRAELKNQLASLMYRLRSGKGKTKRTRREPQVAGNERTSTP